MVASTHYKDLKGTASADVQDLKSLNNLLPTDHKSSSIKSLDIRTINSLACYRGKLSLDITLVSGGKVTLEISDKEFFDLFKQFHIQLEHNHER